jgi:hypothetical protein
MSIFLLEENHNKKKRNNKATDTAKIEGRIVEDTR